MNFDKVWIIFLSFSLINQAFSQVRVLIFLSLCSLLVKALFLYRKSGKTIELDDYYQCKESHEPDYLLDVTNTGGSFENSILYLHGNFTIKEEIHGPIKVIFLT